MSNHIKRLLTKGPQGVSRQKNRVAGDSARDRRDWPQAETAYRAHLAAVPDDQPIWVQFGHCLKEQKKLSEAEAAYRRGIELEPEDADVYLHLGHLLKVLGRIEDAEKAYMASLEIQPTKAAYDEVVGLGNIEVVKEVRAMTAVQDASTTIYLEVDDLLDYLRNHKTLSGIQRVQVGIIQYAAAAIRTSNEPYAFVRTGKNALGFWRIRSNDLTAIIDYVAQQRVSQSHLLSLIEFAEQHATKIEPSRGQTYFVLGAFWGFGANAARYTRLKVAGVSVGVYIYDLIPVTHPEYCTSGLVSEFSFALGDGLYAFDFILTISEFVAREVRLFQQKHGLRPVPVESVLLAHQLNDRPSVDPVGRWPRSIAAVEHRPFVLMVSTIEARKNHAYLYSVWKALLDDGFDMPDLVFVGRFGWRVQDLRDMLEGTAYLDGRIHVLHDLSDVDLEMLYKTCLFTAFPSIVEGWGLPVGESLAHGRPCVASNTSSIPEVGGDLVDYIDPWNVKNGVEVFKKMIFDKSYRDARSSSIQKNFVPRTWDSVGSDLLGRLKSFRNLEATVYVPPLLASGEMLVPGDMSIGKATPRNYASRPLRTIIAESWYPTEPIGCWLRGREGSLWFSSNYKAGTKVVVYVQLLGAPWSANHHVTIEVGKKRPAGVRVSAFPQSVQRDTSVFRVNNQTPFLCCVSGRVEDDGTIYVSFAVDGPDASDFPGRGGGDSRVFYVGFAQLVYAAASEGELRADVIDRFLVGLH